MAINFEQDRGGLLSLDTGVDYNQMAFKPGSVLDNQINKLYQLEEMGFPQPNLQKLKDMDMKQFQEKGIPLSLPEDQYAMAISNYDQLFGPKTMTDAFGVNRTTSGFAKPNINTSPFNVNEVTSNGITNNVRFRDMLFNDLRNLPSDFRTSLGQTKDALVEDFSKVGDFLTNVKDKGIDMFGSGKELALRGIGSIIAGPIGGFIGSAIGKMKMTPEQKAMKEFYGQTFGLDDIGRIQGGIMQGYAPVSMFGPQGLTSAIDKRLATILKTEERKKKKGLKLSQTLIERRKQLEELKRKEEQARVDATRRIAQENRAAGDRGGYQAGYDRDFMGGSGTAKDMGSS